MSTHHPTFLVAGGSCKIMAKKILICLPNASHGSEETRSSPMIYSRNPQAWPGKDAWPNSHSAHGSVHPRGAGGARGKQKDAEQRNSRQMAQTQKGAGGEDVPAAQLCWCQERAGIRGWETAAFYVPVTGRKACRLCSATSPPRASFTQCI